MAAHEYVKKESGDGEEEQGLELTAETMMVEEAAPQRPRRNPRLLFARSPGMESPTLRPHDAVDPHDTVTMRGGPTAGHANPLGDSSSPAASPGGHHFTDLSLLPEAHRALVANSRGADSRTTASRLPAVLKPAGAHNLAPAGHQGRLIVSDQF